MLFQWPHHCVVRRFGWGRRVGLQSKDVWRCDDTVEHLDLLVGNRVMFASHLEYANDPPRFIGGF